MLFVTITKVFDDFYQNNFLPCAEVGLYKPVIRTGVSTNCLKQFTIIPVKGRSIMFLAVFFIPLKCYPQQIKEKMIMKKYDVIIVGAGPGGIFSAYELVTNNSEIKVAVFEKGHLLEKRKCPIDGDKVKNCISCKTCSIMSGFGGAGAFSDGKYNITNDFGGTLYEHIGKKKAIELMEYVDKINMKFGGEGTKLYSTAGTSFKKLCLQNKLNLLDASVRHLGTDINYIVLKNLYDYLENKVDFYFDTPVENVELKNGNDKEGYLVDTADEN